MIDTQEISSVKTVITSPLLQSLNQIELEKFRQQQDYKSRLAEYLTGIPIEDTETLKQKIIADKENIHQELNFPKPELSVSQPSDYRELLNQLANSHNIKIITYDQVPEWLLEKDEIIRKRKEDNSQTLGCYSEDIDSIILKNIDSEDPKVLRAFAHELVHAIDYRNMKQKGCQEYSIEQLEYRAYLLADTSDNRLISGNQKVFESIFGDFMIAGSCFGYYLTEAIQKGNCKDTSDFFKKAQSKEIDIPWFGDRSET
ncbi:MAG TPA: hypothetical protein PK639_04125 [Candidatus Woesebacteria bacterium]|nr:hypothetical protein [Candidatus Woesebacteria bacterium]